MFTSNQIEEIRKKLQLGGTKDTQFPLADSLKGNETIAIVQQGINKQLGLKTLLESVTKWSVSDFLNISKSNEDSYSLEEVLRLIAPINRKAGQVITFKDRMLGTWSIYQFKGESAEDWFNLEYWDDILAKVDNHFKGLILNDCILNETYPKPKVGDFAFVGSTLEEAVLYTCYNYGHWHNTEEPALNINEDLKNVVEEIFNNVEKYPELVQVISSVTPVYTVDYNNYTAEDFIKIKETIDKGGIITVSDINISGLANNNVYHVKSVSDYSITLNTLVQNKIVANSGGEYPDSKIYVFTSINIVFIKTGNKNITENKFEYALGGGGNKFLSDDGTYKEISNGSEPYIWDGQTISETIFNELVEAVQSNREIILIVGALNEGGGGFGFRMISATLIGESLYLTFCYTYSSPNYIFNEYAITSNSVELRTLPLYAKDIRDGTKLNTAYYTNVGLISNDTTITFNKTAFASEYEGQFNFGDTVYPVTFSGTIKWSNDSVLEYKPYHTYQFRILNNIGVMKEIAEEILIITIDGDSYNFEKGSTWKQWVNSNYSNHRFYMANGRIFKIGTSESNGSVGDAKGAVTYYTPIVEGTYTSDCKGIGGSEEEIE